MVTKEQLIAVIIVFTVITVIMAVKDILYWKRVEAKKAQEAEVAERRKHYERLTRDQRYQLWLEKPRAENAHQYGVRRNEKG